MLFRRAFDGAGRNTGQRTPDSRYTTSKQTTTHNHNNMAGYLREYLAQEGATRDEYKPSCKTPVTVFGAERRIAFDSRGGMRFIVCCCFHCVIICLFFVVCICRAVRQRLSGRERSPGPRRRPPNRAADGQQHRGYVACNLQCAGPLFVGLLCCYVSCTVLLHAGMVALADQRGKYTAEQINTLFTTAFTAFVAAKVESLAQWHSYVLCVVFL